MSKKLFGPKEIFDLRKIGTKKNLSQKKILSKKDFGLKKQIIQGKYDSMRPPPQP